MWLLERPHLTLGHDRNRGKYHRPVLAPLKTQCFASIALTERDLATLSHNLDFDALCERFCC